MSVLLYLNSVLCRATQLSKPPALPHNVYDHGVLGPQIVAED